MKQKVLIMEGRQIARNEVNKIERGSRQFGEAFERFWNVYMEDPEMAGLAISDL